MKKMMMAVGISMLFILTAALPIEASNVKDDTEIIRQKSVDNNQPVLIYLHVFPGFPKRARDVKIVMRGYDPDGGSVCFCYKTAEHGPVYYSPGSGGGTYTTWHMFYESGSYTIEGWLVDAQNLESNHISVTINVPLKNYDIIAHFFNNHPNMFPLLQQFF